MRQMSIFLAVLVLVCFALFPAAVLADDFDDLEVTMEVIDDLARIDTVVPEMRGPEREDDDFEEDTDDEADEDSGAGERRTVQEGE